MSLHNWLIFKPFDEEEEVLHFDLNRNPIYLFLTIVTWVLALCMISVMIYDIENFAALVFIGLYLATRSVQVLIEWHSGFKNMAKNHLYFIGVMTIGFLLLRSTW
ncbi:hypothetical protein [Acinetobacter beijerinckii]|uniref:Uncharacterized protein n=1 Tax=Acinetobacter beijerinckii CIP 110307 TaxID=1217648 RepID=N9FDM7_9GAMM|nr:hypothetical protein [Acinetobacter beijerinckii]ENW02976.1 hypothetical protein F933_03382 [Acinetobacter beijerinckii CIP 110307]